MAYDKRKLNEVAVAVSETDVVRAENRRQNREWLQMAMQIAIAIRYVLRLKKISQVELANRMDVSPQLVTKYLSGKENLTLQTICKISKALGISLVQITSLKDVVPEDPNLVEYTIKVDGASDSEGNFFFDEPSKNIA